MLKPITQNTGTTYRERYLAKIASNQFFSLWSYPSLYRPGKKGVTKELADLTVVFGDDIVLFSDKDIAWPSHPNIEIAWSRWYRAAVLESAKQLWGAEKYLRGKDAAIFLDAQCQHPFPFPMISSRTRIHLIAVVSNSIEPALAYFKEIGGEGSSGTLMHAFTGEFKDGKNPFVVGDIDKTKSYVHIFDEESLDLIVSELGTISDLIHYLSEKQKAIRSGNLSLYAGEEDLLAFYLQEQTPDRYGSLSIMRQPTPTKSLFVVPEGEWRAYVHSENYRVRSQMKARALDWSELIDPFSKAIISAQTFEADENPLETHEIVLRVAASENLASRAALGTAFSEKYQSVPAGIRTSRTATSLCHPGRIYIFVFAPWMRESASYAEYRAYRLKLMKAYAYVAPLKFTGIKEAVVVGAQTPDETGTRSEAMIFIKYDEPISSDHIAQANEIMESEKILFDIPTHKSFIGISHARAPRKYSRNELCPCGSLKKNKRCCNISGPRFSTIFTSRLS